VFGDTDQTKLFGRFFRASNAQKASIPDTGLGLAIVRTIVTNHGGDISLASKEAGGTTVTMRTLDAIAKEAARADYSVIPIPDPMLTRERGGGDRLPA
jgi:two-component system, OmpR family, phosphate regulon sensor histidine kinase PhoR